MQHWAVVYVDGTLGIKVTGILNTGTFLSRNEIIILLLYVAIINRLFKSDT
jgi:hypothetical protein